MNFRHLSFAMSPVLAFYGLSFLLPALISRINHEQDTLSFLASATVALTCSILLGLLGKKPDYFRSQLTYFFVVLVWIVIGLLSSLPFLFSNVGDWQSCLFEAFSGVTTTGAESFSVEGWGYAMMWYHQQLQLIGGLGVILIALGLMVFLGLEGQSLYQIESKEKKWIPRLSKAIYLLFLIYLFLYALCVLGFFLAGMPFFESLLESMSTVSTGGFSLHDSGLSYYQNLPGVGIVAAFVMILSSLSYRLHFLCYEKKSLKVYWMDEENKLFLKIIVLGALLCFILGVNIVEMPTIVLQFISMVTTTGHVFMDMNTLPLMIIHVFIFCGMIGGCTGSTSGGTKIIRIKLFFKDALSAIFQMIHPKSIQNVQHGGSILPEIALSMLRGFWFFWLLSLLVFFSALVALGLDSVTSFQAVLACLSNTGATVGALSQGYAGLSGSVKLVLIGAMIVGRVEIMVFYVLLMPSYWRN